jgi:hypothetical protein
MDSVNLTRCNLTYKGNGADIVDLPRERVTFDDGSTAIFSFWKPDADELAQLVAGGTVRLGVWTEPIPPVSVGVEPVDPFLLLAEAETPAPAAGFAIVVQGREFTLDPSTPPLDATDLLRVALDAAHVAWVGEWEIRDNEGRILEPDTRVGGLPQPFYVDPRPGAGG